MSAKTSNQSDFNRSMDSYLSQRKPAPSLSLDMLKGLKKKKKSSEQEYVPIDLDGSRVHVIQGEDSFIGKIVKFLTSKKTVKESDDVEVMEEPLEVVDDDAPSYDPEFDSEDVHISSQKVSLLERIFPFLKRPKAVVVEDEEIAEEEKEIKQKIDEIEDREEFLEEQEEELHVQKVSLVKRFLKLMGLTKNEADAYEPEIEEELGYDKEASLEDMKTLARISANLMKALPKRKLEEYKKSGEFEVFKQVCLRHNIIKERTTFVPEDSKPKEPKKPEEKTSSREPPKEVSKAKTERVMQKSSGDAMDSKKEKFNIYNLSANINRHNNKVKDDIEKELGI